MMATGSTSLKRRLITGLWIVSIYVATALAANRESMLDPMALEARNIAVHTAVYLITALLVGWSTGEQILTQRGALILLILALVLGIGQELLQIVLRQQIYAVNSLFDLFVDTAGAGLGVWIYGRVRGRTADAAGR